MEKQVSATTTKMCSDHEHFTGGTNAGRKKLSDFISVNKWGLTISLLPSELHFLTLLLTAGLFHDVIGDFTRCGFSWGGVGWQAAVPGQRRANPDVARHARWE